jgi:UDP-glucose 4-epimerase
MVKPAPLMKVFVTGGAGFIGSNLVDRLLEAGHSVTVFDNFSGGRNDFLERHYSSDRFRLVEADVRDTGRVIRELEPSTDIVFHLAANADIARGVEDPTLDFEHSLVATFSVLRAMRERGVRRIFYTSGSGVYGDRGLAYSSERHGPLLPVSMYGATKLGAEGLVSAFVALFDMQAWMIRPANIIGPRATHGVVFDFVRRLRADPTALAILGDGKQSKAYLHVHDVIDAMLLILKKARSKINVHNLSSNSFITVNEIARLVVSSMKLRNVKITRGASKVGWKGDVAIVRLRNTALNKLGWKPKYTSVQAVRATILALLEDKRMSVGPTS